MSQSKPPRQGPLGQPFYYIPFDPLMARPQPAQWWVEEGLVPLILMPGHTTFLYQPVLTRQDCQAWLRRVGAHMPLGWWGAVWCQNDVDTKCLLPWDDPRWDTLLLPRLRWLAEDGPAMGMVGFLLDLEYYNASPPPHYSGPMNPAKGAWPNDSQAGVRGRQWAQALAPLIPGGFVATSEIARLPGLRKFLTGMFTTSGRGGVLLGEDFTGGVNKSEGLKTGGTYYVGKKKTPEARRLRRSWAYEQPRYQTYHAGVR